MWEKPNQINYADLLDKIYVKKLNNKVLKLKQCRSLNNRIQALKNKLGHVYKHAHKWFCAYLCMRLRVNEPAYVLAQINWKQLAILQNAWLAPVVVSWCIWMLALGRGWAVGVIFLGGFEVWVKGRRGMVFLDHSEWGGGGGGGGDWCVGGHIRKIKNRL